MVEQRLHAVLVGLSMLCLAAFEIHAQAPADSVDLSIPSLMARPGNRVLVPVRISGLKGREIVSGEVLVRFDPKVLAGKELVRRGALIEDQRWLKADTISVSGDFRVVFAGATGFKEDGDLLFMAFQVDSAAVLGTTTRLELVRGSFNNGDPPARLRGGALQVVREIIEADFTARPHQGAVPLEVQFSDRSSGAITSRLWSFGDGSTSAEKDPVHVYTRQGNYTVALTVTGSSGTDTETRANYILVLPDTTAPQIVNGPQAVAIEQDRAAIQWITDERADGYVEYAPREDLVGARTARDPTLARQHRLELTGLAADTRYFYRVRSTDAAGNASDFKRGFFHTRALPDTRPPAITRGPAAEEITDRGVAIAWRTSEAGTSRVEYSTRENFGNSTQVADTSLAEDHRVLLTNLMAGTHYFYRVRSTDSAGNTSDLKKGEFTTLAAPDVDPPVILLGPVAIAITHHSATIKWVANEPVSVLVNYGTGTDYGRSITREDRQRENQVRLTGLDPNTLYHAQVTATDAAGNTTTSADFEFITRGQPDLQPPRIVLRPFTLGRFADRLVLRWETDEPTIGVVEYGTSTRYGSMANTEKEDRAHTVVLANLDPGAEYHFRVSATDLSGNGPVFSEDQQARTLTRNEGVELRLLESPVVSSRGADRVSLTWKTNLPATSEAEFGLDATYGRQAGDAELRTVHEVVLSDLQAGTLYHARVVSTDPDDRTVHSADLAVTTRAAADTLAPFITRGPEVVGAADSAAFIAWRTNEPTNGLVEYGPDLNYGATVLQEEFTPDHRISLTGLEPGRTYHFRVSSADAAGNGPVLSADVKFATRSRQDRTSPVFIAGPGISDLKADRVTIQWRTDELADSFVDFGEGTGYGNRAGSAEPIRSHAVTLTSLRPATLYHYRASSADLAGNTSTTDPAGSASWSQDLVFRTLQEEDRQPPVIIRGPIIIAGDRGAVISFTTDERCIARLAYGTAQTLGTPAEEVVYEEEAVVEHNLRIGHLKPGTRYLFRLTCQDAAGNVLEVGTPRRAAKVVPLAGATELGDALVFTTEEQADTLSPVITSGPILVSRTADMAILEWTTDEPADSFVEFGIAGLEEHTGDGDYALEHRLVLTGLQPGSTYSYRVRSTDFAGNPPIASRVLSFTTLAEPDLSPPALVRAPQLVYADDHQAILQWSTDEASSAQVNYGEGQSLDRVLFEEAFLTEHRVSLTGLSPSTTYSYQISAVDPSRNGPTTSPILQFTTAGAADLAPPALDTIRAGELSDTSAIVEWTTDEPASSFVFYGTGDSLGQSAGQAGFLTAHRVVLTNLSPATTYRFQVESIDPAGNSSGLSSRITFTTRSGPDREAPPPPEGFRARVGLETAVLSWKKSTAADLAGYTLYRQSRSGPFDPIATGLADTFYVDAGLASGVLYTYYAVAVDLAGNQSIPSAQGRGTPSVRNVPGSVSPLAAQVADNRVTLQVTNAQGTFSGPLTYTFLVSTSELFDDVVARGAGVAQGTTSTSWSFEKELEPGQEYWWRARASDGIFDGPWSFPSFFTVSGKRNAGDFDHNGQVTFDDFFLFADAFGRKGGEAGFDVDFDLSGNSLVDFDDFFLFADAFGKVYAASRFLAQSSQGRGLELALESRLQDEYLMVEISTPDAAQWRGLGLVLGYDPEAIELVEGEVVGTDFLRGIAADRRLSAQVPLAPGQVALLAHRIAGTPFSGAGSVGRLRFHLLKQRTETEIELKEGAVQTTAGPARLAAPPSFRVRLAPVQFALRPNYPNPFNPETVLAYDLPLAAQVQLGVFDALGQRVRLLVDEEKAIGRYRVIWDGRDQDGQPVASGVYFYRLEAGPFQAVRKMVLLR